MQNSSQPHRFDLPPVQVRVWVLGEGGHISLPDGTSNSDAQPLWVGTKLVHTPVGGYAARRRSCRWCM